ncbi:MAG TPA: PAS domain S-box protein, partial [Dehalococcoidia bacterium]|nr:PAS domain S-box protein [Dehalococcoidia bacterium]
MSDRRPQLRPLLPSRGHLLSLVQSLPRPALLADVDGRLIDANEAACKLLGVGRASLIAAPLAAFVSPEDGAPASAPPGVLLATLRRAAAPPVPVRLASASVPVRGGTMVLHTLTDITEEQRTQQALQDRERTLRDLFDGARDIVYSHDFDGNFTAVNPSGLRLYGYTLDEMLGANVTRIIDPDYMETARQAVARQLQHPATAEPFELLTHARDGRDIWLEVNLRILFEADRPVGMQGIARDITARRATEAALRESEERLAGFVAAAPVALLSVDRSGVFTLFEGKALQAVGLRPRQFLGQSLYDVCAGFPEIVANLDRALAGETFTAVVDIDGVAFEMHHTPIRDAAGAVTGMLGVGFDATARVQAERALNVSQQRLHAVAANAPLAFAALDRDGVFTVCEGKLLSFFRHGPADILGQPAVDVFSSRPEIVDLIQRALRGQEVVERVTLARREIEATLTPMLDAAGAVTGVTILALDVSDRLHAEQALLNALEFQQLVMESTRDAIVAADRDGRIILINDRVAEMTGCRREELIGHHVRNLLAPDDVQAVREATQRAIATERPVAALNVELQRKDGDRIQVALNIAPLMEHGEVVGVVGTAEDISARLRTERQLAAQRHLLELIALGQPLPTVLHELVAAIEEQAPGALCSVLLLDDAGHLRHGAAPSLPDAYNTQVDGIEIGPAVGSCGTAAFLKETVIVTDIASDPLWSEYRALALAHDLRSCWSTPVLSSTGDVLGTFAIYYREPRAPDDSDAELIRIATHVAGIAIQRQRAEEVAASRTEELERLYTQLVGAHGELATSKARLEEKSRLLERALEAERERARRDPLTGALNHAAIAEVLRDVVSRPEAGSVAVAMVDVDGLKAANDTYGHPVGDAVLLEVARALAASGAVVGRYGGDEFVAVLPGADRAAAEAYRAAALETLLHARVSDPETGT